MPKDTRRIEKPVRPDFAEMPSEFPWHNYPPEMRSAVLNVQAILMQLSAAAQAVQKKYGLKMSFLATTEERQPQGLKNDQAFVKKIEVHMDPHQQTDQLPGDL